MHRAPRPHQTVSGLEHTKPDHTRLTFIKIGIQIRLIHADMNDHLSGVVNCYLEEAPRFCLCVSNSIQNYKNTKGSSFTRIKHKFSVDSETQKSSFWVFLWSKSNRWPWTRFTVMSEDTVQNCLIYACNVSCLFWCRVILCGSDDGGSRVWSEFAGRLPEKHQQSLIM